MLGGEQEGMGWSDEEAGFELGGCSLNNGRGKAWGIGGCWWLGNSTAKQAGID